MRSRPRARMVLKQATYGAIQPHPLVGGKIKGKIDMLGHRRGTALDLLGIAFSAAGHLEPRALSKGVSE